MLLTIMVQPMSPYWTNSIALNSVLFILYSRIVSQGGGQERELSRLSNGAYFGELALITHKPRAANVYAASPEVKVAFLDVHAFERLLGPCMDIMKRNFNHYEEQLVKIFGSAVNISDLRWNQANRASNFANHYRR